MKNIISIIIAAIVFIVQFVIIKHASYGISRGNFFNRRSSLNGGVSGDVDLLFGTLVMLFAFTLCFVLFYIKLSKKKVNLLVSVNIFFLATVLVITSITTDAQIEEKYCVQEPLQNGGYNKFACHCNPSPSTCGG